MKKWLILLIIGIFSLMPWVPLIGAKAYADEENPNEEQNKIEKLKNKFDVSDSTIRNLRDQKLGYGEIDSTLGLAQQMPGGTTDENIQKVLSLRQGDGTHKKGWGNVAKELGVKMGDIKGNKKSSTPQEPPTATSAPSFKESSSPKPSFPGHSSSSHHRSGKRK